MHTLRLILALIFLPAALRAQPADSLRDTTSRQDRRREDIVTLEKMVVTTTRTPKPLKQSPVSVSIISQSQIAAAPARNVDDLLTAEKGIILKRPVGMAEGIPSDINIRGVPGGITAARVLILVDGIPTNASGSPFLILNEVPMESIKKVEVVRGPFSCLYGANAFSGVINIITRDGKGRPGGSLDFETAYPFSAADNLLNDDNSTLSEALSDGASSTLWSLGGTSSGEIGNAEYLVSAGYRTIGNFLARDSGIVRKGQSSRMESTKNHGYEDYRLFSKCALNTGKSGRLSLSFRFFQSDLGYGLTKEASGKKNVSMGGRKILLGPSYTLFLSDNLALDLGGYFRQVDADFYRESISEIIRSDSITWAPSYWDALSNDWQISGRLTGKMGAHNFTVGFDNLWNSVNFGATEDRRTGRPLMGSAPVEETIINFGAYLQDEISLFSRLFLVPGIRFDYHNVFGWAVSPKIGALLEVDQSFRLRSSFGRGFRAPSLTELYLSDFPVNSAAILTSNPELNPETILAFDAGFVYMPLPILMLEIDYFHNSMSEFIVPSYDTVMADVFQVTFDNTDEARSWGLDGQVSAEILRGYSLFTSYTWTNSKDLKTGYPLDYLPEHRTSFGLNMQTQFKGFGISGTLTEAYTGPRSYNDWENWNQAYPPEYSTPLRVSLEAYWRTDMGVSVTWRKRYRFGFTAQNLTNAHFEEMGGFSTPGRIMTVKAGVGF